MRVVLFMCVAFLIFATPAIILRFGFPRPWKRWLNRIVLGGYGIVLACTGLYFITKTSSPTAAKWAVVGAHTALLAGFGIVGTAIMWGPLLIWHRKRQKKKESIDEGRRSLLLRGAQMAVGDRSILEPFMPKKYLKGHYEEKGSHLYTSSGLGHWLPFRMNCPCEAPLIRLKKVN